MLRSSFCTWNICICIINVWNFEFYVLAQGVFSVPFCFGRPSKFRSSCLSRKNFPVLGGRRFRRLIKPAVFKRRYQKRWEIKNRLFRSNLWSTHAIHTILARKGSLSSVSIATISIKPQCSLTLKVQYVSLTLSVVFLLFKLFWFSDDFFGLLTRFVSL